jgi:uncharacterized protein (DUF2164 family)
MATKMTEREITERKLIARAYKQGRKDFAKEVITRLEEDYPCTGEYNDGIDDAIRVIEEMAGDSDGRE